MADIHIPVINRSGFDLPAYATPGASGMDLRAVLEEPLTLAPLERALVPTGIFMELPEGYEAQVRPRSGLALKKGLTCLNSPGTIDADYRGEVGVILVNLSNQDQDISPGERIAQLVIQPVVRIQWTPVETIGHTRRSDGGFGHTGTN